MRKRPEIPKSQQKKVARQLLERQKRADVYEKGLKDVGKGFLAGSAYPVDIAEMLSKPALTPSASVKAASMRPRGGGIPETVAPVQDPKLKGTYPYVAKKLGLDPDSAESIAGSFFSLDPMAKAHAVAMGTKLVAGKLAGLGMGAAMFGGLKKVDDAADVAKPIFTSPGGAAAADISKETIPANKVKSQLEGRGVGKEEMEWTGFNEWIKTKKGEVPKAEVEEFFQQNQIQVQEVVRGGKGSLSAEKMEEIATDEVLHDLGRDYYKGKIISKMLEKQQTSAPGSIIDPAVISAYNNKFHSPWEDLTRQQQQGFATRYRLDNDLPGLDESAFTDAEDEYDLLLRSWGEGSITEAEMDKLNGLFDDIGSRNQPDIMYQNILAEIEAGEYPLDHLDIEGAGLQTKFSDKNWQLPGGENYRELLLIVPPKKVPYTRGNVVPLTTEAEIGGVGKNATGKTMIVDLDHYWYFNTPDGVISIDKKQNKAIDYLGDDYEAMPPKQEITQEEALEQVLERQPDPAPRYTGGHFEENDVAAHIRFNERVDPDGNKVLFIEEIQSDWAHKGQDVGFKTPESDAVWLRKENIKMRQNVIVKDLGVPQTVKLKKFDPAYSDLGEEGQKKFDEVSAQMNKFWDRTEWKKTENGEWAWHKGDEQISQSFKEYDARNAAFPDPPKELSDKLDEITRRYDPNYARRNDLVDEYNSLTDEYNEIKDKFSGREIKPGPFVQDIHQWTNLALKRMIRWGSDNGFDSIAWVTGKQSADRYKVSKTVDSIYWNPDSTRLVAIQKGSNDRVINELVPEDKLADYIGKEPANRLLESQKGAGDKRFQQMYDDGLIANFEKEYMTNSHSLEGADLDIGGEYHKLIYDEVLTAQAKKIGKKHGAKVEEGRIGDPKGETKIELEKVGDQGYNIRWVEDGENNISFAETKETAEELMQRIKDKMTEEYGPREKVWTMRLTNKLQNASREGLPYYVALPPLVIGGAAAQQRTEAQKQQSKSDAQQILAN